MRRRFLARLGALTGVTALLASCGVGGGDDGVVTLDYWCWGETTKVEEFNATHTDIQINHTDAGGGNDSSIKLLTASRAGNAPDVSCVEYQTIPALVVSEALVEITDHAGDLPERFDPGTWQLTSFDGHVYGVPIDIGPMVFLYNRARFDELGLRVPTTWDEFADVAAEARERDPDTYVMTLPPDGFGGFAGLAQQAGGQWWEVEDGRWTVGIADETSLEVAAFWQDLLERDLVQGGPILTPEWNNKLNKGEILAWPTGVWGPGVIYGIAESQAGDWAIAPLPGWGEGESGAAVPFQGGSALTVTDDDKIEAAVEFISWMNTSEEACALQIAAGEYPASLSGQAMTAEQPPPPLAGEQEDYWEIANYAATNTLPNLQWGPNVNTAQSVFSDAVSPALRGQKSLVDALRETQRAVVDDMARDGFDITD
ncbi:extracellular solute-binding protein [Streptomyces profundus]|uniref:extracellular solute-binding protein n=1 Tax=Streptomyces profundus TaxID=2867410 RepID=UPI001D166236|nr:extracellular solute-binding protein [Streptomyces sp. MA3_2.13]UED86452.1 extracellular solute-binding protein [Streptomyces sp. MA3_2.13]